MSSFKCSGCGRTDFFTSHGLTNHKKKCARKLLGKAMAPVRERNRQVRAHAPSEGGSGMQEYVIWMDSGYDDGDEGSGSQRLDKTYMASSEDEAIRKAVRAGAIDEVDADYASAQISRRK